MYDCDDKPILCGKLADSVDEPTWFARAVRERYGHGFRRKRPA